VRWVRSWSDEEIEANRKRDRIAKELHFRLGATETFREADMTSATMIAGKKGQPRRKNRKQE
jgi:hypothetical protein